MTHLSSPAGSAPDPTMAARRRFLAGLLLIACVALGLRVAYVLGAKRHEPLLGDQIYYSALADELGRFRGFRDPFQGGTIPSADHPPLTSIIAAPAVWFFGDRDAPRILTQRLLMAGVGAVTVIAIGYAGRRLAVDLDSYPEDTPARWCGWCAAAIAAVHPGLWINDGLVMSESVGALTIALVIGAVGRALDRPGAARMAIAGAAVGLAALARAEALLLAPLLLLPTVLTRRGPRSERPPFAPLRWSVAAGLGLALALAPWVGPNLVRFDRPTLLSTNDGLTLLGTNCDPAWKGPSRGFWIFSCIEAVDSDRDGVDDWTEYQQGTLRPCRGEDGSTMSANYRAAAFEYLRDNWRNLPEVIVARELRMWGWRPAEMVYLNRGEGREPWASWAAHAGFVLLVPLGVLGWALLRRRERPVWPLAVHTVAAALTAAMFYGLWRFRVGAEVGLVIGAGVALQAFGRQLRRRAARTPGSPEDRVQTEKLAV